ncbi:MAG: hypothetical protein ABSE06_16410 [Anaerolineaceae bacterium]
MEGNLSRSRQQLALLAASGQMGLYRQLRLAALPDLPALPKLQEVQSSLWPISFPVYASIVSFDFPTS